MLAKARAEAPVSDKERRRERCTGIERLKGHSLSGMFLIAFTRPHQLKYSIAPGRQGLPFAFDIRLNQIPEDWRQVAVRFRKTNGIRDGDQTLSLW